MKPKNLLNALQAIENAREQQKGIMVAAEERQAPEDARYHEGKADGLLIAREIIIEWKDKNL